MCSPWRDVLKTWLLWDDVASEQAECVSLRVITSFLHDHHSTPLHSTPLHSTTWFHLTRGLVDSTSRQLEFRWRWIGCQTVRNCNGSCADYSQAEAINTAVVCRFHFDLSSLNVQQRIFHFCCVSNYGHQRGPSVDTNCISLRTADVPESLDCQLSKVLSKVRNCRVWADNEYVAMVRPKQA